MGNKVVPSPLNCFAIDGKNIGDLLSPSGLAYWICDDGAPFFEWGLKKMASGGLTLCTNSFSVKEVSLLV